MPETKHTPRIEYHSDRLVFKIGNEETVFDLKEDILSDKDTLLALLWAQHAAQRETLWALSSVAKAQTDLAKALSEMTALAKERGAALGDPSEMLRKTSKEVLNMMKEAGLAAPRV
jgi:hypothetical protein